VFGLDKSCISLCRDLLDMSLFDKLIKNAHYSKKLNELKTQKERSEFCLKDNIDFAKEFMLIDNELNGLAHQVRIQANKILHIKNKNKNSREDSTLDIIKNTIKIIERLYSQY